MISKNQSERQVIEVLFKVQISPHHTSSNTNKSCVFTYIPLFVNLQCFQWNFPLESVAVCLQNRWKFLSDYLVTYSGQKSNKPLIKKIHMTSDINSDFVSAHPTSFIQNFVSGMQSLYVNGSQDAMVLQTCHEKW